MQSLCWRRRRAKSDGRCEMDLDPADHPPADAEQSMEACSPNSRSSSTAFPAHDPGPDNDPDIDPGIIPMLISCDSTKRGPQPLWREHETGCCAPSHNRCYHWHLSPGHISISSCPKPPQTHRRSRPWASSSARPHTRASATLSALLHFFCRFVQVLCESLRSRVL